MSECCKTGFNWNGSPTGTETTLADKPAYVTGSSKSAAIIIVHDVFGWTFKNLRLLADHFAKEADATVYLPDFFDNEIIEPSTMEDPEKRAKFDIPAFIGRNSKDKRGPEINKCAKTLKEQFPKVGAIGYCYGAWACLRLAADPTLIDAISIAHPSLVETTELDNVKVPVQIIVPENDPAFTPELKAHANKVIPTLGVYYEYVYFPGLNHGFAAKGDPKDAKQKFGLEKAKRDAVGWFNEFLH